MTIPQEAVEAAEKKIVQAITGFVREHRTISSEELTKDVLTAALPAIEKEIRAQVEQELYAQVYDTEEAQREDGQVVSPATMTFTNDHLIDVFRDCLDGSLIDKRLEKLQAETERDVRAQVAAELRGELPIQLAETAQSRSGWLSDAQVWLPEPDALYKRIDLVSDGGDVVGSIDISHVSEHAARIAEGADNA